ncbi:MAG: hypothetical protein CML67_06615 [Rhodobacteraceae bacterium]|nr:hypothetical protein [Paracoccaceae bacterium]
MAERLGEALLDLDTDDRDFNRGVERAGKKADGLGRTFDMVSKKALMLGRNLALAGAAAAGALGYMVKTAIDQADAMSKSAQRAGVTTEALSRLAWAGELSDVSVSTLTLGLGRLTNVMAQVAAGTDKTSAAIFEQLGIAITDAQGSLRSADAVLIDLADRFSRMESGADKAALAIKLFGRSGAQLIPLLNNGRKGLADMADESDRLGKTISTEFGRRAEVFNDTMTRIWSAGAGLVNQLAEAVLPQLQDFADMLADPEFVENAEAMAQGIAGAFQLILEAINKVTSAMRWLDGVAGDLLYAIAPPDPEAVKRWKEMRDALGAPTAIGNGLSASAFDRRWNLPPVQKEEADDGNAPVKFDWSAIEQNQKIADAAERTREAIKKLTASLQDELDIIRESDPYQRELIRLRDQLAEATPKERKAVEDLIEAIQRERAEKQDLREYTDILKGSVSSLAMAVRNNENVWDAMADNALSALDRITDKILNEALDAMLQFNDAAGGSGGGGGGLFGALASGVGDLFAGFFAEGGLIPNGTFGIVGERGPEPVIGTSRGAMVLPNSSLRGGGGGGGTEVNVYNTAGGEVRQERRRDGDGREIVDIVIERVKEDFATGGFDAAQAARFGVSPTRVKR